MKRGATENTKFKRLCRHMSWRDWQAAGILELLWHLTAREAPRGDIGRLSDEDIAIGLDYMGDDRELVSALLDAGWLDDHPEHRLVVHDWWEHADDAVHARVARSVSVFADGQLPKLGKLKKEEREHLFARYAHVGMPEPPKRERVERTAARIPDPEPVPVPDPDPVPEPGGSCEQPPKKLVLAYPIRNIDFEFDYDAGFGEVWNAYPQKGRTKIEDSKRMYVDRIRSDPVKVHGEIMASILPDGKWNVSDLWHKRMISGLAEFLRQWRWKEDPEPYDPGREEKPPSNSGRKSAAATALEEA